LPSGIEPIISEHAGDYATLSIGSSTNSLWKYRSKIRSYLNKLPGFTFTGFRLVAVEALEVVISEI